MKLNVKAIMVDTSAWIEFFRVRGNAELRERVISLVVRGEAAWCEVIRLELWNGARGQREIAALEQMESNVALLPITENVWRLANHMARSSRLAAKNFPTSDLLVAACAGFHGVEILHKDRHFDQLKAF